MKANLTCCAVTILNFNTRSSDARSGTEKSSEIARNPIPGALSDAPRISEVFSHVPDPVIWRHEIKYSLYVLFVI